MSANVQLRDAWEPCLVKGAYIYSEKPAEWVFGETATVLERKGITTWVSDHLGITIGLNIV